jgi:hypothetical protein
MQLNIRPVPAPALTNLVATPGLRNVVLKWDMPTDPTYRGAEIWAGTTTAVGSATKIASVEGTTFTDTGGGISPVADRYYWVRAINIYGRADGAWSNMVTVRSQLAIDLDIAAGAVKAAALDVAAIDSATGNLASSSVNAAQIVAGAITATKFASGIEPVSIVAALPTISGYTGPKVVMLSTDGKIYRLAGSPLAWTTAVPTTDLSGTIATAQIANGAVSATKFASGIEPISIVTALPTVTGYTGPKVIMLSTDGKLYRLTGSPLAWSAAVPAADLSGTVAAAQIAAGAIDSTKFATGVEPIGTVSALPVVSGYTGPKVVLLSTDGKLYRLVGTTWTAAVPAVDLSGTIAGTQITDGAISTAKIAANAITAAKITAGTITATELASDSITSAKIAANAITAGKIAAGTIVAADIAADTITGAKIAADTITASEIAANTITAAEIAANTITAAQIKAAAIGATEIAAGAITAEKLLIAAPGSALNADPGFEDASAWTLSASPVFVTLTDGKVGNKAARSRTNAASDIYGAKFIPVDLTKVYRVRAWARKSSTSNGTLYIGVRCNDAAGANVVGNGTFWYAGAVNSAVGTGWTEFVGYINTPNTGGSAEVTLSAACKTMAPIALLNYGATAGYMEIQDLRIEEVLPATLIQGGAITTDKLAANAVTAAKIAANTITATQIASNTITATQIAANAITASELAANSITAGKIAAGVVSAAEIAAGAITASKLAVIPENMCPDPYFTDAAFWAPDASGWYFEAAAGGNMPDMMGTPRSATLGPGNTTRKHIWTPAIPYSGMGQTLRLRARLYNSSNQTLTVTVRFLNAAGTSVGDLNVTAAAGSNATTASAQMAVPSTAVKYQYIVYNASGNTMTGHQGVSAVKLDVAASADLIVDGAITATKIATDAVTADKIKAGEITTTKLAANAVTAAKIAAGTITAAEIASDAITSAKISAGAITAGKIAAGAVTATSLAVGSNSENVLPDSQFNDPVWWNHVGIERAGDFYGTGSGWKSRFALRWSSWSPGYAVFRDQSTEYFPLIVGATYRVEIQVYMSGDFNGYASAFMHLPNKAWFNMGTGERGWSWNAQEGGLPVHFDDKSPNKGVLQTFSATFTADNVWVHRAQFRFITKVLVGYIEFGGISVVRVSDNVLIADGAITASKMNLPWGGYINSGQWGFDAGDGFWLQGGDDPRFSIGAGGARLTFQKSTGTLKMKGAIEGSSIRTSVLGMESARMITDWNFTAPFVIFDTAGSYSSAARSRTVTLSDFCGPAYNGAQYHSKRFAAFKRDVFIKVTVNGDFGWENLYIDVEYHKNGSWANITSTTADCNYRAGFTVVTRYTPWNGGWDWIAFRARTTSGNTYSITMEVQVFNFNDSPYGDNTNSGINGSDATYTPPPPKETEPWCVDYETARFPNGMYARDTLVGDLVEVWNNDAINPDTEFAPARQVRFGYEESYRITSASGAELLQSKSTPMTLRDGRMIYTPALLGEEILVKRGNDLAWERVVSLENIGERKVVKLSLGDLTFFAGTDPNATIATHNIQQMKP